MAIWSWYKGEEATNDSKLPPPPGKRGSLLLLGQTLSFHDAAHDEVVSSVKATGCSTVRLNVIARNIALVTSYEDAKKVLDQNWDQRPDISRAKAYDQLMSAFYSAPNLLLEDEDTEGAKEHRQHWDESIQQAMQNTDINDRVKMMVACWMRRISDAGGEIDDLYDACKDLGHDLALGTFLSLDSNTVANSDNADEVSHEQLRKWSEEMLRGQFTLPVGVNVGFFQNTFSKGQAAKVRFDGIVKDQLERQDAISVCPFAINSNDKLSRESILSHHSMFSSSLVVKAFASIASALLLQVFHIDTESKRSLADRLHSLQGDEFDDLLESIITETERLSPPIIGVMRQVTSAKGIDLDSSQTNVPCGWDVWPYFPLINRDKNVFSGDADLFKADRYLKGTNAPLPLTFGAGVKNCAGQEIIRLWLRHLILGFLGRSNDSVASYKLQVESDAIDRGVQCWLGWLPMEQSISWRGVKQLPTQRPRKAIAAILMQSSNQVY